MVLIQFDNKGEIEKIGQQLGSIHDQAPKVMAAAINATARRTNTLIKQAIRKTYTYHRPDKMKKAFKIPQRATATSPSAKITVTSETPHLTDFEVTPSEPYKAVKGMAAVKVRIFRNGSLTELISSKYGTKAFIAQFPNDKLGAVQRVPGQTYSVGAQNRASTYGKYADMTKLKALFGPSLPKMAARVHEESIREQTEAILQENIQKQIKRVIDKHMSGK